jgi:uncharacterized membrane protein YcaP (DUF421 family)
VNIPSFNEIFSAEQSEVTLVIMIIRTFFIYVFGILLVVVNRHFIRLRTRLDLVLRIVSGSLLANAVSGSSPFLATLGAVTAMAFFNWLLAMLSYYYPTLEKFVKGAPIILLENGELQEKALRHNAITKQDLMSALRDKIHTDDIREAKQILFENTGEISIIKKKHHS